MSARYEVARDMRLDLLVAELMGTAGNGAVEAVLDANPGLSRIGPIVPAGTIIVVPDLPSAAPVGTRVWE